ncbi:ABC-F family ATP-binding cassette domain-containing protein, partial [Candidatus Gracilibacteria bacterium]|nr:ABC-F family ATP-binding cassette domain-containing protein [Candidatus Gracilibacteria bacterium]
ELFCNSFLATITEKIKEETKMKRLMKYLEKEFDIENTLATNKTYTKRTIDTLPKNLLQAKPTIASRLIKITELTKSIRHTELFDKANLQINREDKFALIGKNGSGKTTFLKMLVGIDDDFDGEIDRAAGLKIGYLTQDLFWKDVTNTLREEMLQVFPDITAKINRLHEIEGNPEHRDEIRDIKEYLEARDGYNLHDLQLRILTYFGFDDTYLDRVVTQLSGGEQMKVQIAKFIIQEVDILILDEPTNHLDIEGIVFLEHFCRLWKKAIISISHDVTFINNTCQKIVEISEKKLNIYTGNYDAYVIEKQKRYETQLKHYEVQEREIEKQEAYINRFRYKASTAASVQSRIKMLDRMEKIPEPKSEAHVKPIVLKTVSHLPEKIMELKSLVVGYPASRHTLEKGYPGPNDSASGLDSRLRGNDDTVIVSIPYDITVTKSDKIGIIGRNGAGKTTFLKTILGELKPLSGEVIKNQSLTIGSYSQVLADLDRESTVMDELTKGHDKYQEIRTMLGGLLIQNEKWHQTIGTLSGGERAKVALTKMLLSRPHVIIMDEPTNHLDLHSKEAIQTMLKNFNGVSIIVSHDRDLLAKTSTAFWLIQDGQLRMFHEAETAWKFIGG